MGERRKRKSMWDKEEETKHFAGMSDNSYRTGKEHHSTHDSGQYHEFSSPGPYRAPNFRYHSGQPSLETIEDDPVSPMNGSFIKSRERVHEGREMGGESRYYQKMSPDFRSSHSLGNERSHSYRYPGRGRSRSPSRTRGRSPSRSLSRDRERERARGRSRSRSRSRGDDMAESWRNRAGHGHISRHSYSSRGSRSELRDDGSDPYYGEDDQFQNKNRSTIPCKDFIKGNCRWGDTCRFSHHFASGETFAKGPRYMSSDKDSEQHPHKNGKPLCKYFAAGRCDRDNCWFSHEDPRFNSLEGRQGKVADEGSLRNDNRNWKKPERGRNLIDRDIRPSHPARNATYGGDLGAVESVGMENMDKKQEELMLHGSSQFQNQDGNLIVQGPKVEAEFSWEPWEDDSQVSHIQQPSRIVEENNPMSSVRSNVHDELKDPRKTADPNLLAGENLTQNGEEVFSGHSLIPSKTHIEQNLRYPNPSHLFADLQLQSQMQNHQKAIQTTEVLETKILDFFPNIVPSESTTQFTNPIVFPTQGLENEHFRKDVDTQVLNPMGMSTAQFTNPIVFPTQGLENEHSRKDVDTQVPNSMGMALFETANMQSYPAKVSDDSFNPIENEGAINEPGKPAEEGKQMQVERSSPLPIAVGVPDNSEVDHSGKLKQEPVIANSVVDEGKIAPGEESKGDKNDKPTETLDGHGKNEESNANKDDKGMRLFKNSLIEFVKDILKPTWKEGRMSREVHKTIVKKVVDKVTSTIQVDHIPKTQEKVEQYLAYSQPKIAKLVQAYVGRSQKTDS